MALYAVLRKTEAWKSHNDRSRHLPMPEVQHVLYSVGHMGPGIVTQHNRYPLWTIWNAFSRWWCTFSEGSTVVLYVDIRVLNDSLMVLLQQILLLEQWHLTLFTLFPLAVTWSFCCTASVSCTLPCHDLWLAVFTSSTANGFHFNSPHPYVCLCVFG
jgi:hypothetical protein